MAKLELKMAEPEKKVPKLTGNDKELLKLLREVGGKGRREEDIIHEGERFVLPEKLTTQQAITFLQRKIEEDEEPHTFQRIFRYRPWDGANATYTVFKRVFGLVGGKEMDMGFFGKRPPAFITINTGVEETVEVPWGNITIPILPDATITLLEANDPEMGLLFCIVVEGPRKYRFEIDGIFKLVEDELLSNSIYRGKAIDGAVMPSFLDLRGVQPERVTYSADVMIELNAHIWSLLNHSDEMRSLGLPLKRAILLEGKYGTGKTLAAYLTAQVATKNGWSFLYARPGKDDLTEVMRTARLYQPAVVFMEDMDTLPIGDELATTANQEDGDKISAMLDLFDGITAKGTEIVAILTTNHPENITKAMLRPGRLDAIIHIGELDDAGIEKLIRANTDPNRLDSAIDFKPITKAMKNFMPAFVKEAVDRTIRYAIARGVSPENITLKTEDFVAAAEGLYPQLEMMNKDSKAKEDTLGEVMKSTVRDANGYHKTEKKLDKVIELLS